MLRLLLVSMLLSVTAVAADPIAIDTAHSSASELATKSQLEHLIAEYNLGRWSYTHKIVIDEKSIPHSHPVLTLHTRHLKQDDELLSTYVHEQLHWFFVANDQDTDAAISDLKKLYPKVPVGYPDGANDEQSTYLHILVCYEEGQLDDRILGSDRTREVMNFWAGDHYRWVYRTVLQDGPKVADIIATHKLQPVEAQ
ncbi:MAG TPA: hypothetical protein VGL89_17050 [Candidatus Koribacter sp.]